MKHILQYIKERKKHVTGDSLSELTKVEKMITDRFEQELKDEKEKLKLKMLKFGPNIFIFKEKYIEFEKHTSEIRDRIEELSEFEETNDIFKNFKLI